MAEYSFPDVPEFNELDDNVQARDNLTLIADRFPRTVDDMIRGGKRPSLQQIAQRHMEANKAEQSVSKVTLDDDIKDVIYEIGMASKLPHNVAQKLGDNYKEILITSMIAGTGSLLFLSSIIGVRLVAYKSRVVQRVNELRKRELEKFPNRVKSINAKFDKVLNGTYRGGK